VGTAPIFSSPTPPVPLPFLPLRPSIQQEHPYSYSFGSAGNCKICSPSSPAFRSFRSSVRGAVSGSTRMTRREEAGGQDLALRGRRVQDGGRARRRVRRRKWLTRSHYCLVILISMNYLRFSGSAPCRY
jgi:hypothetical protein